MDWSRNERHSAAPGARLRLRVPPDPQFGRYVRAHVAAFASALDIPHAELADFLNAVGEALANAIEHSGVPEPIDVSVWLDSGDHLVATVVDRGVGFTASGPVAGDRPLPDALAERGRGIPIMRTCSDSFSVRTAPGKGTAVTIGHLVQQRGRRQKTRYAAG